MEDGQRADEGRTKGKRRANETEKEANKFKINTLTFTYYEKLNEIERCARSCRTGILEL
jgi:hypothetical protein